MPRGTQRGSKKVLRPRAGRKLPDLVKRAKGDARECAVHAKNGLVYLRQEFARLTAEPGNTSDVIRLMRFYKQHLKDSLELLDRAEKQAVREGSSDREDTGKYDLTTLAGGTGGEGEPGAT